MLVAMRIFDDTCRESLRIDGRDAACMWPSRESDGGTFKRSAVPAQLDRNLVMSNTLGLGDFDGLPSRHRGKVGADRFGTQLPLGSKCSKKRSVV